MKSVFGEIIPRQKRTIREFCLGKRETDRSACFSAINIVDRALLTRQSSIKGRKKNTTTKTDENLGEFPKEFKSFPGGGNVFFKMSLHEKFMQWMDTVIQKKMINK